jgi:hypothetical protein
VGLALLRTRSGFAMAVLGGTGAASIAATGLASLVCQGFPLEVYNPLVEAVAPLLAHGYVPRNLLQMVGIPGVWSALPAFAALAIGIVLLLSLPLSVPGRAAPAFAFGCALAAALVLVQWTATSGDSRAHAGAVRFLASIWEPDHPPGSQPF